MTDVRVLLKVAAHEPLVVLTIEIDDPALTVPQLADGLRRLATRLATRLEDWGMFREMVRTEFPGGDWG